MCILDLGVASLVKYCLVFNNSIGGGGGGGGVGCRDTALPDGTKC